MLGQTCSKASGRDIVIFRQTVLAYISELEIIVNHKSSGFRNEACAHFLKKMNHLVEKMNPLVEEHEHSGYTSRWTCVCCFSSQDVVILCGVCNIAFMLFLYCVESSLK